MNNINIMKARKGSIYQSAPTKVKNKVMRRFSCFDGCGADLTSCENYDEALLTADLDYGASKETLHLSDGTQVPDTYAFVKSDDPTVILGINGKQYTAIDNRTAFQYAEELVNEGVARYELGGATKGAKNTLDYAKSFLVLRGDDFEIEDDLYNSFISFSNSFDGSSGISFQIVCQRLVCLNGMCRFLGGKQNQLRINIQHSKTAENRIRVAREIMKKRLDDIEWIKAEAKAFMGVEFTKAEFEKEIIPHVLKQQKLVSDDATAERKRGAGNIEKIVNELCQAYAADDIANYTNSAYKVLLALTDWESHSEPLRDTSNASLYMSRVAKGMLASASVAQYIANTRGIKVYR